jgi:membrane protein
MDKSNTAKPPTDRNPSPRHARVNLLRPVQVLKEILMETGAQIRDAELTLVASSLAYTTLLSIVPALAVSFSLFHAFGGMDKLFGVVEPLIIENLAQSTSSEATKFLRKFITNAHAGAVGASGFVALLATTIAMLSSIEKAINRVWKTRIQRNWFIRLAIYWLFISLGPVALGVVAGFAVSFMKAADDATSALAPLKSLLPGGTAIFIVISLTSLLIYKFVPSRRVQWAPALMAAITTGIGWNLARYSYNWYVRHFVSYNRIYGSLGAIPILLLWIYIMWLVILSGAALSAALQHRMERFQEGSKP